MDSYGDCFGSRVKILPFIYSCEKTCGGQWLRVECAYFTRFSMAAESEEPRRTLPYVEPLSNARTPLGERRARRAGVGRVRWMTFSASC
jgi:hypothetical protein